MKQYIYHYYAGVETINHVEIVVNGVVTLGGQIVNYENYNDIKREIFKSTKDELNKDEEFTGHLTGEVNIKSLSLIGETE